MIHALKFTVYISFNIHILSEPKRHRLYINRAGGPPNRKYRICCNAINYFGASYIDRCFVSISGLQLKPVTSIPKKWVSDITGAAVCPCFSVFSFS